MGSPAAAPNLSNEQLAELLPLLDEVSSVELKVTVSESDHLAVAAAVGLDPLEAQLRQVYFFDTPDLALEGQGIVLRARRVQGRSGDSIVKLRPTVPSELPKAVRTAPGFKVEVDAMPGEFVCSATMKRSVANAEIRAVIAGGRPLSGLFSKAQLALLSVRKPNVALDGASALGPILVMKRKFDPDGLERRLTAELWLYPDNSRVLELSTKCKPKDAFRAAAETRAFLFQRGLDLSGEQQAKTRRALELFSARMAAGDAGEAAEA